MNKIFILFVIFTMCLLNFVSAQETKENANTDLSKGGTLEVLVIDPKTKESLDNVNIEFYSTNKLGAIKKIITNNDGIAQAHLEPGKYTIIKVYKNNYYKQVMLKKEVTVEEGKTKLIEFSLEAYGTISGVIRNENGEPVSGALIIVNPPSADQTATDSNGIFTMMEHSLGFTFKDTPYIIARDREHNLAAAVELLGKKENLDIKLSKGIILSGKVVDSNDNRIPDLKIELIIWTCDLGFKNNETVEVDKHGHFQIKALPGGFKYSVYGKAERFGSDSVDIQTSQNPGEIFDFDPIVLKPANMSVSGLVVDYYGKPIANAFIHTSGKGQPNLSTTTNKEGKFTLENLCAGTITIGADLFDTRTLNGVIQTEGGAKDVKIILSEPGSNQPIQPQFVSLSGKPLPDIKNFLAEFKPETIQDKSVLICFFDYEQRPSRNCILELSKKAKELKEKDLVIVAIQASKIEQEYLDKWLKENSIDFQVGIIKENEEQTKFNWGVKALPWLILTDKKHIVTNEGFSLLELDKKLN
ncbi:MAG: carboxypeptidase regulatory-like domain-containing protein [Sedimentisphaerales bacterium]|nr:carboxypeptidase regulatory-like domain-containing protein [Sedimentisphaerales bacterium]